MEKEQISQILTDYAANPTEAIPAELEDYLKRVASSGETWFAWSKVKPLFLKKLHHVMNEWSTKLPEAEPSPLPNVENIKFDVMKERVLEAVELFTGAPFTIQRLCELLTNPQQHYKSTDKFMRGLEKNLNVISTVDPYGNKIVSESKMLVNGMDSNGFELKKVSSGTEELSDYLSSQSADNNVTQLETPSGANAVTSAPGTSDESTGWFGNDSWNQNDVGCVESLMANYHENSSTSVDQKPTENQPGESQKTDNSNTDKTSEQVSSYNREMEAAEQGKADSSSGASTSPSKSQQPCSNESNVSDSESTCKSTDKIAVSYNKETAHNPENNKESSEAESKPTDDSESMEGIKSSEEATQQTETMEEVDSSNDSQDRNKLKCEKVKRKDSDSDESEQPLAKRGRIEEDADSTQHTGDKTEGKDGSEAATGSQGPTEKTINSDVNPDSSDTKQNTEHDESMGFELSTEQTDCSSSQDDCHTVGPSTVSADQSEDSCSSISSSTEESKATSEPAKDTASSSTSEPTGNDNEQHTTENISDSHANSIQDSHITTADKKQSNVQEGNRIEADMMQSGTQSTSNNEAMPVESDHVDNKQDSESQNDTSPISETEQAPSQSTDSV